MFPLTCMLVCAKCATFGTRDRGCSVHPAFPAPSFSRRGKEFAKLGRNAPREWDAHLPVVPAKAGTHTPRRKLFENNWSTALLQQLWTVAMGPCSRAQLRTRQGRRQQLRFSVVTPSSATPKQKTRPSPCGAASSASLRRNCSAACAKSSALSHSTLTVSSGGTTENSGWRADESPHLLAVLRRQHRARDVGDPPARLHQRRRAVQHLDLVFQPHLERARPHPPFRIGVAPPGAGAGAGRVDQHEIGRRLDVGERVGRRPSASAHRHCARRRATAARGSARAGACHGRSRSAGPCPASSPPAPASCRRRRRRDRSPARRVLPPTAAPRAASPRPAPRSRP